MTIGKVDVTATLKKVEDLLAKDKTLSDSTRSLLEVLVLIVTLMADRLNLNSRNSSKPPSSDLDNELNDYKLKCTDDEIDHSLASLLAGTFIRGGIE